MGGRLNLKELAGISRRLGTSLDAGIDLRKSWEREALRARGAQRRNFGLVALKLSQGEDLASALDATHGAFPALFREIARVGDQTGKSELAFYQLADHYDHLIKTRREFIGAITMPLLQLFVAIGVIALLILIMGWIPGDADMLGWGLKGPQGVVVFLTIIGTIVLCLTLIVAAWREGKLAARFLIAGILRIPYIGKAIHTIALARIAWTLSLVTNTGMDLRRSITSAMRSTGMHHYVRQIEPINRVIGNGHPVHEAMRATAVFPDEFVDTVEVGEQTGKLSESLERLSRELDSRAKTAVEMLTKIAAFGVWGLIAGLIIWMIMRLAAFYVGTIESFL